MGGREGGHDASLQLCHNLRGREGGAKKLIKLWPKTSPCQVHGMILGSPKKVLSKACHSNLHEKRNLMTLVSVA